MKFERQNQNEAAESAGVALERETALLESFRKRSGSTASALALAFAVLSAEGCAGLGWYGLDPVDRIQRSAFERSPHKAFQLDRTTWEFREGDKKLYTLTMGGTKRHPLIMLEGENLKTSVRIMLPQPDSLCAAKIRVFGAQFIVREIDLRNASGALEIVADGYEKWDPSAKPMESFEKCP